MRSCTAIVLALLTVLLYSADFAKSSDWNYNEQEKWPTSCSTGKMQSPIALFNNNSTSAQTPEMTFNGFDIEARLLLKNNGHTVHMAVENGNFRNRNVNSLVYNGGLPFIYVTDNWHFHWKSEHTIDGKRYPLELHIVNYAKQYYELKEALKRKNGIAVLAVLFELSPHDNTELEPIVDAIYHIANAPVNEEEVIFLHLNKMLPNKDSFFRYIGSLTTPPCTEHVIWTVFNQPLPISKKQLMAFRKIQATSGVNISNNYRSLQDMNSRDIFQQYSSHATTRMTHFPKLMCVYITVSVLLLL